MIGYVDRIGMHSIVGWVAPNGTRPRAVQARFGGAIIGRAVASLPRPDVAAATGGKPDCGFVIAIAPPYDVDEIQVEADGEVLPKAQLPSESPGTRPPALAPGLRLTTPQSTARDLEICQRLIDTYRRLLTETDQVFAGRKSMWTGLISSNYRHLADIVAKGTARELCNYLLHLHKRPETWGISQGPESYYVMRNAAPRSSVHSAHAALYAGELFSLAEYLGLLPVENPDQGRSHANVDLAALIGAIRAKTGIEPIFPHRLGGLFCLDTGAGLVQQRDVWALYAALRIADLLPGLSGRRVCEIGGGLGQLCHYARLLGVKQYVLIDLPHVSLMQAFLLMRANPDRRVALFDGGDFDRDADICIYPTFMYERAPDGHFDLTVNVDSMPEMGWDNALSYARTAARKSAGFLSINQEAKGPLGIEGATQISVTEVFEKAGTLRPAYRFRSWVRRGYVESYFLCAREGTQSTAAAAPSKGHTSIASGLPRMVLDSARTLLGRATQSPGAPVPAQQPVDGYLDTVGPEMITGWARRTGGSEEPAEIDILVDGRFFMKIKAEQFSAALKNAKVGSGYHAFAIRAPVALFDGKPHQVGARIAGTDLHLCQSPQDVQLPNVVEFGPTIARSIPVEPWIIDAVTLKGSELVLSGWAIPPRHLPDEATFSLNGKAFDSMEWPLPRHDIHQLYFFHPNASRSGFRLRADLARILETDATELAVSYVRSPGGPPVGAHHDYFLPLNGANDVALPDAARRKRVSGTTDADLFNLGGYTLLRKIDALLAERYATSTRDIGRILDWGCGCGRLLRYLAARGKRGTVFGADIDGDNVAWCHANIRSAVVATTPLLPPTNFEPGQFNLIIGNSVFTHLAEKAQFKWLAELQRILAPGGLAMVSVQSIADLSKETFHPAAYERLLSKGFISEKVDNALQGLIGEDDYYRSAFHTHEYIRSTWTRYFSVEDIISQFSNNMQDLVVLRKPA